MFNHPNQPTPTEHVDLSALKKSGIKLGYTPDVLTEAGASSRLLC